MESKEGNDNDKKDIKHKKAASAKIKSNFVTCKCYKCAGRLKTKHSDKCCFMPGQSFSIPLDKDKCLPTRCNTLTCELFAYELWGKMTPELIKRAVLAHPSCNGFMGKSDLEIVSFVKKLAQDHPECTIGDMFVPNWAARNVKQRPGGVIYLLMSYGFKYSSNDAEFIKEVAKTCRSLYNIIEGGPPQGWTEKYEKENKEFAFQLARRVFFDQTGHPPYISRATDKHKHQQQ